MNAKQKAVQEIRRFGESLKGFIALGDELERIGGIEAAAAEADARLAKARADEEVASKDLAVVLGDVAKAKATAAQLVADARKLADSTVEVSKRAAGEIVAKAKSQGADLVVDAEARKDQVEAAIARQMNALREVNQTLAERQGALAGVTEQLARIRSQVGA